MSDTFFTSAPHWQWLIVWYFFIGGIAGGSYCIAALLDLWGQPQDRPLARLGYYIALLGIVVSGVLLIVDLNRPERFWHMLLVSDSGWPVFKYWSPMSVGAWAILLFGVAAFLSSLAALEEEGYVSWSGLKMFRAGTVGKLLAIGGGLCGFFVASYTGVLLSVTNRPIWADTTLVGVLFLLSGASTATAVLILFGQRRTADSTDIVQWLSRFDTRTLVLELIVIVALIVSLGTIARVWLNAWGVILGGGVVLAGILLPLVLHLRPHVLGRLSVPVGAVLILIGGFLLRMVVVLSAEGV